MLDQTLLIGIVVVVIIVIIIENDILYLLLLAPLVYICCMNETSSIVGGKEVNYVNEKFVKQNRAKLLAYLDDVFAKFSKPTEEDFQKVKELYSKKLGKYGHDEVYPMQVITVKNSGISSECNKNDDRVEHHIEMMKQTCKWAAANGLPIPDVKLYFWISDAFFWYQDKLLPMIVDACPINVGYIIAPDTTFICLQTSVKYKGQCFNWDQLKEQIIEMNTKKKEDIIFFRGTSTTERHSKLREDLAKDKDLSVDLSRKNFEHPGNWSKYKYLLDLPGHYPWSNRLKYLAMTKSCIIHVDSETYGPLDDEKKPAYIDKEYRSFINLILEPDIDYYRILHTYYNDIRPMRNPSKELLDMQKEENMRVAKKIKEIVSSDTPEKYDAMVNSAYDKVSNLSLDDIYFYMYNVMIRMANL